MPADAPDPVDLDRLTPDQLKDLAATLAALAGAAARLAAGGLVVRAHLVPGAPMSLSIDRTWPAVAPVGAPFPPIVPEVGGETVDESIDRIDQNTGELWSRVDSMDRRLRAVEIDVEIGAERVGGAGAAADLAFNRRLWPPRPSECFRETAPEETGAEGANNGPGPAEAAAPDPVPGAAPLSDPSAPPPEPLPGADASAGAPADGGGHGPKVSAADPVPPPDPADVLAAHLDGIAYYDRWTPDDDADLLRLAKLPWTIDAIAQHMDRRADWIKARFALLTGHHRDGDGRWRRRFSRDEVLGALEARLGQEAR